jgi:hypothetical protein
MAPCAFVLIGISLCTFRGTKVMDLSLSSLRAQGVGMKVRQGEELSILLFLRHPLPGYPMVMLVSVVM